MALSGTAARRAVGTLMVVAAALAVLSIVMIMSGRAPDHPTRSAGPGFGPGFDPFPGLVSGSDGVGAADTAPNQGNAPALGGPGGAVHTVRLVVESDGPLLRLGYVTLTEKVTVPASDRTSWSTELTITGQRPVVQVAFQVLGAATFGTCTVYVDGAKVMSNTAKGQFHVGICTG